jgi:septal ring factor EnvC (AmiA/AmiB activator)
MRVPVTGEVRITTLFGVQDPNAFFGRHSGIDFAVNRNDPVVAPVAGSVWWAGSSKTGGNMIILFDGRYHRLMHNTTIYVRTGDRVSEGQHIADAGDTGLAFGVHVHYDVATEMLPELRPSSFDKFINPLDLIGGKGGSEDMINDADNEFARWHQLAMMIRGRELSRDEFRRSAVGLSWLHAMEILADDPEAQAALDAQSVGQIAARDNWQGQIGTLQSQLQDAQKQVLELAKNPTQSNYNEVQSALQTCEAKTAELNAALASKGTSLAATDPDAAGLLAKLLAFFMARKK